jgi:KaiC/GvpD/RAD55 family RecA-like ATPase
MAQASLEEPYQRLVALLKERGKWQRIATGGVLVCCPAHGDSHPSLKVDQASDGKVLLSCKKGCDTRSIVQSLGLTERDLFPASEPSKVLRAVDEEDDLGPPVTLAEFAAARRLPEDALRFMGWSDEEAQVQGVRRAAIAISYGTGARVRIRLSVTGKRRFTWKMGQEPILAYDPDGGRLARAQKRLVLVEGESDAATLLYAGFPALGLPGNTQLNKLLPEHLVGVETVFWVRENDNGGGAKFSELVAERLKELGFAGARHEIAPPGGAKDVSALYLRDPTAFAARFECALAEAVAGPAPKVASLSQLVPSYLQPVRFRLDTGFPTLDQATRGGIPSGKVVMLAGAPGAAKTSVSVYLADRWERAGACILYLAADEAPDGILMRLGQLAGFSRDALEDDSDAGEAVRIGFAKRSEGRAFYIADPDAESSLRTLEDASEALFKLAGDAPRVLVIDSLQTCQCAAASALESGRERMDAKIAAAKSIARRGSIVLCVSEMSRAGYMSGERGGNVSALAASKESGSIEYGASLLLGLRSVTGGGGAIAVEVAKNRLGRDKPEFVLEMDYARASLREVAVSADQPRNVDPTAQKYRERIVHRVQTMSLRSQNEICDAIGGSKTTALKVIGEMVREGRLHFNGTQFVVKISKENGD